MSRLTKSEGCFTEQELMGLMFLDHYKIRDLARDFFKTSAENFIDTIESRLMREVGPKDRARVRALVADHYAVSSLDIATGHISRRLKEHKFFSLEVSK